MDRASRLILLACACGCLIGAVLAQAIGHTLNYSHFWAVGAFVGGLAAWALADPAHFAAGARRAWAEAGVEFRKTRERFSKWVPEPYYWRAYRAATVGITVVGCSAVIYGGLLTYTLSRLADLTGLGLFGLLTLIAGMMVLFGSITAAFGWVMAFMALSPCPTSKWNYRQTMLMIVKDYGYAARTLNPFAILVFLGRTAVSLSKGIVADLIWTIGHGPAFAKWLWNEVRALSWAGTRAAAHYIGYTIAYVHDSRRTICMVDTTLMVAVCYLCFSNSIVAVLMSVVLGPLIGLINYRLVAPRLQKVYTAN